MPYSDLQSLLGGSQSSRDFFLSLPIRMQFALHEQSAAIHTAEDLRRMASQMEGHERALRNSERSIFG